MKIYYIFSSKKDHRFKIVTEKHSAMRKGKTCLNRQICGIGTDILIKNSIGLLQDGKIHECEC